MDARPPNSTNPASLIANAAPHQAPKPTSGCYKFAITMIVLLNVALAAALAVGIAAHVGQCLTSLNSTVINVLIYGSAGCFALEILWQIVKWKRSKKQQGSIEKTAHPDAQPHIEKTAHPDAQPHIAKQCRPAEYRLLSWNIGSNDDYRNQHKTTSDESAVTELRAGLLHSATSYLCAPTRNFPHGADFICLQETYADFSAAKLEECFRGFTFLTDLSGVKRPSQDTAVGWDTSKFTLLSSGFIQTSFSTKSAWAQLQDNLNGNTILLSSAHLTGYNLSNRAQAAQAAEAGNAELRNLLAAELPAADLHIIGMDANAEANSPGRRLQILHDHGYCSSGDSSATFYDNNLKRAARLDHVFAKSSNGVSIALTSLPRPESLLGYSDNCVNNPSDHMPMFERLVVTI